MKLSNRTLLIAIVVLGAIYAALEFTEGEDKSESLRDTIVEINKDQVTSLEISSPGNSTKIKKEGDDWKVQVGDNWRMADASKVKAVLNALEGISPDKLVSRKEEKWSEYQVDSTGKRVKIFEGDNNSLDLIIGRLGMKGQNQYYTFVRLADDSEIYSAEDFMSFSVDADADSYRDNQIMRFVRDSLSSISYSYEGQNTRKIEKSLNGNWVENGVELDSAGMEEFMRKVSYKMGRKFYDKMDVGQLGQPKAKVSFDINGGNEIVLKGYIIENDTVIHSSYNPVNLFADGEFYSTLFVDQINSD